LRQLCIVTIVCLCFFIINPVEAGTTGKISGTVIDEQTGEPLPGANVIVEGTAKGAATDLNGIYFIINLPPATYVVRAEMMGFTPTRKSHVRVVPDMTTKINFQLVPTTLETQSVTVIAEKPAIKKDLTASLQSFSSEDIAGAPITEIADLMEAQSGISIFEENERASVIRDNPGDGLHIRGGRENETAFLVDGVRVDNPIYGGSDYTRSSGSTVTEMMTILGTFNAEYGGKMSGVVNLVTKEGSKDYNSHVNFSTDNFGLSAFNRNTYRGDLVLSGPVPAIKNLYFFSNIQLATTDGRYSGYVIPGWTDFKGQLPIEDEEMNPLGEKVSAGWQDQWSSFVKLTLGLTPNLKIMASYFHSEIQAVKYYHEYRFIPNNLPWSDTRTVGITLKTTYTLNPRTFAELAVSKQNIDYWMGSAKMREQSMIYGSRAEDELYGFKYAGSKSTFWADTSETNQLVFTITSQISNTHMLKTGYDFRTINMSHLLCDGWSTPMYVGNLLDENGDEVIDENGSLVTTYYENNKADTHAKPVEMSAFIQDKMEFETIGMILVAGIRGERWDINTKYMENPSDPIETNLLETKAKTRISPRLGVSYPISDVAAFHFAYGHFYQFPSYLDLLSGVNENGPYPDRLNLQEIGLAVYNSNIQPEKSVTFEAGVQTQVIENLSLNITAFYREMADLIGIKYIMDAKSPYRFFDNLDFGQSKGFELTLNKRLSSNYSMLVNYTLAQTMISTSTPLTGAQMVGAPIAYRTHLADWDRTHNIASMISIRGLRKWRLDLKGKAKSGTPWTKYAELENTERKPWNFNLDLKISKNFHYFGFNENFYLQVSNLTDRENIYSIYSETGKWDDDGDAATHHVMDANPRRVSDGRRVKIGIRVSL